MRVERLFYFLLYVSPPPAQLILAKSTRRTPPRVVSVAVMENALNLRSSGEQRIPEGLYERVLESASNLVILDTPHGDDVLSSFRQTAQRRGHSVYAWSAALGLASLREHGITVAGSKRLPDALRFVLQSSHFGVYVFPSDKREFTPQIIALLRQIARGKEGGDKRVVVMGHDMEVSTPLDRLATLVVHKHGPSQHFRLRDGRWVRG